MPPIRIAINGMDIESERLPRTRHLEMPPRRNANREWNWADGSDQQVANNPAAERGRERQHQDAQQIEMRRGDRAGALYRKPPIAVRPSYISSSGEYRIHKENVSHVR
jgi:hypothetical protein